MADLRRFAADVGLRDPRTILQSGNLVFQAPARQLAKVAGALAHAVSIHRGFSPNVVVRTLDELRAALARNPFHARALSDPSHVLVMFLAGEAPAGAAGRVGALAVAGERFALLGREVYLDYPQGIGRSRVAFTAVESAAGVAGTARNVATLARILAAADG